MKVLIEFILSLLGGSKRQNDAPSVKPPQTAPERDPAPLGVPSVTEQRETGLTDGNSGFPDDLTPLPDDFFPDPDTTGETDMPNQSYMPVELVLKRDLLGNSSGSIGEITRDGNHVTYILEDTYRDIPALDDDRGNYADVLAAVERNKVYGSTRIPAGLYEVGIEHERGRAYKEDARYRADKGFHHNGIMELKDVPGFKYIQIHPGNYPADTLGCLLPGKWNGRSMSVSHSRIEYRAFYSRYAPLARQGVLTLRIIDGDF